MQVKEESFIDIFSKEYKKAWYNSLIRTIDELCKSRTQIAWIVDHKKANLFPKELL
jgi:hypothetical protein